MAATLYKELHLVKQKKTAYARTHGPTWQALVFIAITHTHVLRRAKQLIERAIKHFVGQLGETDRKGEHQASKPPPPLGNQSGGR
jgi:hypothetical protein